MRLQEVVDQDLLKRIVGCVVVFEDLGVVKRRLVVIKRVELADDGRSRCLSVKGNLSWGGAGLLTAQDMGMVLIAVLDAVHNEW